MLLLPPLWKSSAFHAIEQRCLACCEAAYCLLAGTDSFYLQFKPTSWPLNYPRKYTNCTISLQEGHFPTQLRHTEKYQFHWNWATLPLQNVLHSNRQNLMLISPPNDNATACGIYWKYPTNHPLTPAEARILAFEIMIDCNSRTDCARESVKTSWGLEVRIRFDQFKKRYLCIWKCWEKCKFLIFRKCFLAVFKAIQKIPFTFPYELYRNVFCFELRLKTTTKKNSNQSVSSLFWGEKFLAKKMGYVTWFSEDVIRAWKKLEVVDRFFVANKTRWKSKSSEVLIDFLALVVLKLWLESNKLIN